MEPELGSLSAGMITVGREGGGENGSLTAFTGG